MTHTAVSPAEPAPLELVHRIVQFVLELEKLKGVTRRTKPLGLDRYENSAEHSWQIAMFAASLAHHAETPVDVQRVIGMLLVHDIGEIDTGDTIVFAEEGVAERKAAERAAVGRIFAMLPEPQASTFLALWEEFEEAATPESKYAHAIDRAMPALLNLNNAGQSWRENGISYDRIVRRIGPPIQEGCPSLWAYIEDRLREARAQGWFDA